MANFNRPNASQGASNSQKNGGTVHPCLMKTVAGLLPDQDRLPYSIRTSEIIRFLQKKLDVIITDVNNNLPDKVTPMPQIQLRGYTVKMSNRHYPFALILPSTAEYKPNANRQPNPNKGKTSEVDISQDLRDDDDDGDNLKLYRPIYEFLKPYMYDPNVFKNPKIYGGMNINSDAARTCHRMSTAKKTRNKGNGGAIMILLDPFALLHAMLEIPEDPRVFSVTMSEAVRVKDGEYIYKIKRTFRKKKQNGQGMSEWKALMHQINGSAGATLS